MELCPICSEWGHPEEAHMEILDGEDNKLYDFSFGEPGEPMSREYEEQTYPERFWVNPVTGEWERWEK